MHHAYNVGDHVRVKCGHEYFTATIEHVKNSGFLYVLRLDPEYVDIFGHNCNGLFKEPIGFYVDDEDIVEVLNRDCNSPIDPDRLLDLLLH